MELFFHLKRHTFLILKHENMVFVVFFFDLKMAEKCLHDRNLWCDFFLSFFFLFWYLFLSLRLYDIRCDHKKIILFMRSPSLAMRFWTMLENGPIFSQFQSFACCEEAIHLSGYYHRIALALGSPFYFQFNDAGIYFHNTISTINLHSIRKDKEQKNKMVAGDLYGTRIFTCFFFSCRPLGSIHIHTYYTLIILNLVLSQTIFT